VCYFNTGWARDGWDIRVKLIKDMCDKYELKFNELKASVMNEHRTTEILLARHIIALYKTLSILFWLRNKSGQP
jgi:hypothetical protein